MSDNNDTQIFKSSAVKARQERFVNLIVAECRLIPFEAEAPQPSSNIHHRAP